MLPKVVLIVVATFFPITVGLLGGFKSVDPDEIDLMRSMGASRWQIMRHVKIPAALPQFFSGLKISAAYAIVGAVIAEWLGGFSGLGVYMTRVRKAYSFEQDVRGDLPHLGLELGAHVGRRGRPPHRNALGARQG